MKKYIGLSCLVVVIAWGMLFHAIFDIPPYPSLMMTQNGGLSSAVSESSPPKPSSGHRQPVQALTCFTHRSDTPLDHDHRLDVLVWNIYKENRPTWQQVLTSYTEHTSLNLLQESKFSDDFQTWLVSHQQRAIQVDAFSAFSQVMGVMTFAKVWPQQACSYDALEPLIRLPKSALVSRYRLSNGDSLMVVNIHAVNFALGVDAFQAQLTPLLAQIKSHQGPVIFAGDFNTWNQARIDILRHHIQALGLSEVSYPQPDHRRQFMSFPLDHVFYRGLKLLNVTVPMTDASDHSPILLSFHL